MAFIIFLHGIEPLLRLLLPFHPLPLPTPTASSISSLSNLITQTIFFGSLISSQSSAPMTSLATSMAPTFVLKFYSMTRSPFPIPLTSFRSSKTNTLQVGLWPPCLKTFSAKSSTHLSLCSRTLVQGQMHLCLFF